MASPPFDPYHKWLGIPPEEQPPHHYRLLGLALFESDPDVVDTAADQRMSYLRTCATGAYVAESQRLLNEVSAARRCLLDPRRKAEYDGRLQTSGAGVGGAAGAPAAQRGAAAAGGSTRAAASAPASATAVIAPPAPPLLRVSERGRRPVRRSSPWPMLSAFLVGAAGLGGLLYYFVPRFLKEKPGTDTVANVANSGNSASEKPKHVPLVPTGKSAGTGPGSKGSQVETPAPVRIGPRGRFDEEDEPRRKGPRRPRSDFDDMLRPAPGFEAPTQPVSTDAPRKRAAVPVGDELASAEEQVRNLHGADVEKARKPDEKVALARRLVDEATRIFGDAATGASYVILRDARTLAVEGGDVTTALAAISGLARRFEIDPLPMKVEAVRAAAPKARDSVAESLAFAEAALLLAEECGAADDYESSGSLLLLATGAARRVNQKEFADRIARVRSGLAERKSEHEAYVAAKAVLETMPEDPAALFTAGAFVCFRRHDWPAGLALLEKTGDALLAEAVRRDRQGAVFGPDQVAVGDAWWDWVESKRTKSVLPFRAAAHYWYRKAQPTLAGIDRAKVDKRLQEIGTPELPRLDAPPAPGDGVGSPGGSLFVLPGTAVGPWTELFDGTYLTNWRSRTTVGAGRWSVVGSVALDEEDPRQFATTAGRGILVNGPRGREDDLLCLELFGDLHVQCDFCIARNSSPGILLQGRYEIQLSDSQSRTQLSTRSAGGIPGSIDASGNSGHVPTTNAARAPGEWQSLEIVFRAPRFDKGGLRTQPARFVRVVLNGEVVQQNIDVAQPTPAALYSDDAETGPLVFRGGWGPLAVRNLRVRKLRLD